MPDVYKMQWMEVHKRVAILAARIHKDYADAHSVFAYPVPRGGSFVGLGLGTFSDKIVLASDPVAATFYVDDVLQSGNTYRKLLEKYGQRPLYTLVDKTNPDEPLRNSWVCFPWERELDGIGQGVEEHVTRFLQFIGEDPNREGLKDTPRRVVKSWKEMFSGYKEDPAKLLTVFEDGACDELVLLKDVEFESHCEHHVLPFIGSAHIAYVPNKRVIGVSKLVRLLEIYSKRLQIQERLCQQVTEALDTNLKPLGSACIISARHLCMVCRGVRKQNSVLVTSSLTGVFKEDGRARQELMMLIKG